MPNWVTNRLIVSGNDKDIKQLFNNIKGDEAEQLIDFNKIIPMPESLDITSGSVTDESIFWALSKMNDEEIQRHIENLSRAPNILHENLLSSLQSRFQIKDLARIEKNANEFVPDEDMKKLGIKDYEALGKTYLENLEKYGYTTWYDWCVANWDTKWNAHDCYSLDDHSIEFQTAWSTPERIIKTLSEKYPSLEFEVSYADEDFGYNVGKYTYQDGEIIEIYLPDGGSPEANKLAEEILGYSPEEEYDELDDNSLPELDEPDMDI